MAVDLHSHPDAGMAQLLLNVHRAFSITEQQTCEGLGYVMQLHITKPGLADNSLKDSPDVNISPAPMTVHAVVPA